MKIFFKLLLLIFFNFFLLTNFVYASDFKTDYYVDYNLKNFKQELTAKVKFNIKITNLKSDVYVSKFSISFPDSFAIKNIKVSDDFGEITPQVFYDKDQIKIEMKFSNPNIGKGTVNNFYLSFDQSNLFKVNGNIWEVGLPTVENKTDGIYQIKVILPLDSDKKISIAKPKPSSIVNNEIYWLNPKEKTVYAVFGDNQIYQAELIYNLKNQEVYPVFQEIAFPPETLYQKVFVDSISPIPEMVYQDTDGNYLARYSLKPLEAKKIIFKGFIQVFTKPQDKMIDYSRDLFLNQKNYLLSQQSYWTIKSLDKIKELNSVESIYRFVVNSLSYDYQKLKSSNNLRLGAEKTLINPTRAVCLEFTDLFVGLAREKGIFSREIEGYGFSFDPKLQPLSLASDVLHAWPEYYNQDLGIWQPVDPTWENTSGIDYFSSFDLNHIVFAIHGKKSDYPYPAGTYKTENSKDIFIKSIEKIPTEKKQLTVLKFDLSSNIFKNKTYQGKIQIKNKSNVYLFKIPLEIKTDNLEVIPSKKVFQSLAPYQEEEFSFQYSLKKKTNLKKNEEELLVYLDNEKILAKKVKVHSFDFIFVVIFVFLIFLVIVLLKFFKRKND